MVITKMTAADMAVKAFCFQEDGEYVREQMAQRIGYLGSACRLEIGRYTRHDLLPFQMDVRPS
jgi:hypothetical protein